MADRESLLADILENPDQDLPRLIYADWLDDRHEFERAEFIRVQCGFAKLDRVDKTCPFLDNYGKSEPRWKEGKCQCKGCVLIRREDELYGPVTEQMLKESPSHLIGLLVHKHEIPLIRTSGIVGLVRRGFISSIYCSAMQWQRPYVYTGKEQTAGQQLMREHPIEQVVFRGYMNLEERDTFTLRIWKASPLNTINLAPWRVSFSPPPIPAAENLGWLKRHDLIQGMPTILGSLGIGSAQSIPPVASVSIGYN